MTSPVNRVRQNEMEERRTTQAANPGVADGFDRRTLLTGASRLALMAVAGGFLGKPTDAGSRAAQEYWVDGTYWSDGTGWTDA